MPYTTKHTIDPSGMPDTDVGAAGNTTSVPGYVDVSGLCWRVHAGRVASVDGSNKALANVYSVNNPALNQEVIVDYPVGLNTRRDIIQFRWRDLGSHSEYVQVFLNNAGGVTVYDTTTGPPQSPPTPGSLGLNATDRYRVRMRVETASGMTTLTIQIHNLTTNQPHQWNNGSDAKTWTWPAITQIAGRLRMVADGASQAGYDRIEFLDDAIPPSPVPGVGSIVGYGATSLGVRFAPVTGGTPPYEVSLHRSQWPDGIYATPTPANQIASWTNQTNGIYDHVDAGLSPDMVYVYRQKVTDSLGQTAVSGLTTQTTGAKTRPYDVPTPSFYQIGDSITAGGNPQSVVTMAAYLSTWLGAPVVGTASGVGGGGLDNTYVNDDLTPRTTLVAAADQMQGLNPTDFQCRIGINDIIPPATWKEKYKALIAYIRSRKAAGHYPKLVRIWLLTPTFRHGAPSNFVPDTEVSKQLQYRSAMREIVATDTGAAGVVVLPGDFTIWEMFSLNPGLLADGIHPTNPAGYAALGLRDAMWWYAWWVGGTTPRRGLL